MEGFIRPDKALAKYGPNVKLIKIEDLLEGSGAWILDQISIPDGKYMISLPEAPPVVGLTHPKITPGQYSGTANTYQTLATWTVTGSRDGKLHLISLYSDKIAVSQFQLVIKGVTIFTNKKFQNAVNLPFPGVDGNGQKLNPSDLITLSVKSDGATTITADGLISGVEAE